MKAMEPMPIKSNKNVPTSQSNKIENNELLIKSSFRSLEDFSFEEIKSDTELLKSEELHVESEEALGKAQARFYKDCEFSMESPGMIFMYGATLVLVGLAIIGIYVAKRKT